ncbi:MAG TPA: hypothetical protein PLL23_05620 [Chitinophagaceae bacterium]|nr:hypothetical protein [Chitinophagaceae bacterium]
MSKLKVFAAIYIFVLTLLSFAHLLGLDLGPTRHEYTINDFFLPVSFMTSGILVVILTFFKTKPNGLIRFFLILSLFITGWILVKNYFEGLSYNGDWYYFAFRSLIFVGLQMFGFYIIYKILPDKKRYPTAG